MSEKTEGILLRALWAANGASGWATWALVVSALSLARLDVKSAVGCAAWVPLGALAGGIAGVMGIPTLVGPLDAIARTRDRLEPRR